MEHLVFGMMNLITKNENMRFFLWIKLKAVPFAFTLKKKYAGLKKVRQRRYRRYWLLSGMGKGQVDKIKKKKENSTFTQEANINLFFIDFHKS